MIIIGKSSERSTMRKFGVAFLVFAVIGIFFVTLAPFNYTCYTYEYEGETIIYEMWSYFNGRTKFSSTIDGVVESVILGEAIMIAIGNFPVENIVFIAVGIGLAMLGGLYKTFAPMREDKRIFTFLVILGGGFGLAGTLLFTKFHASFVVPIPELGGAELAWGFYFSIVVFSLFILIGLVTVYDSLKTLYAVERDDEEMYTDLLK